MAKAEDVSDVQKGWSPGINNAWEKFFLLNHTDITRSEVPERDLDVLNRSVKWNFGCMHWGKG